MEGVLEFKKYSNAVAGRIPGVLQKVKEIAATIKPNTAQLLSILRIYALRGEYLNRLEKMNNKLRNLLSDFD